MPFTSFAGRGSGEMGQKVHVTNRGSSSTLMNYLDKEEGVFYDRDNNKLTADQATQLLDGNTKYLDQGDAKFHSKIFAPSQKELRGITDEKLIELGHADVDEMAKQFSRAGVKRETMVYVIRLERDRYFEKDEISNEVKLNEETGQKYVVKNALKNGEQRQQFDDEGNKIYYVGDRKPGDQRHLHIVTSGQIDRAKLPELKASSEIDQKVTRIKISPSITSGDHKKGQGAAKGAFNRVAYTNAIEKRFDEMTGYDRPYSETFEYARLKNSLNVSLAEKARNEQKRIEDDKRRNDQSQSGSGGLQNDIKPQKEELMENKQEQAIPTPEERMADIKSRYDAAKETSRKAPAQSMNDPGKTEPPKPVDLSDFSFDRGRFTPSQPKQEPKVDVDRDVTQEPKVDGEKVLKQERELKPEIKPKKSRGIGM